MNAPTLPRAKEQRSPRKTRAYAGNSSNCCTRGRMVISIPNNQSFPVPAERAGKTLAACLRIWLPGQSWARVRRLIETRRVKLNGEVWLDDARRLKAGDTVEVLARAENAPAVLTDQIP